MILQTGIFIKVAECENGDVITILNAGEVRDNTIYTVKNKDGVGVPKKDYVFKISHKGSDKVISMNKISRENLAAVYGANTEKWIGKKASIEMCLFSNNKRGIVLSPVIDIEYEETHDGKDEESESVSF